MAERFIICDGDYPSIEGGVYHIAYNEMVDGYRHAYADPDSRRGRRSGRVRYARTAVHPPDPRCPECHLAARPVPPGPAATRDGEAGDRG